MRYLLAGLVALALASGGRADTVAFDFTGGHNTGSFGDLPFTAGYTFTINSPIVVTQVGVWDRTPLTPLVRDHPVGIWDEARNLLVTGTVLTTSPLTNSFRYAIADFPVELKPGNYVIGAFYPSDATIPDQPLAWNVQGFLQAAEVTFGQRRFGEAPFGIEFPISGDETLNPAWFGPSFQFVQPTPVPEPAGFVLLAIAAPLLFRLARPRAR